MRIPIRYNRFSRTLLSICGAPPVRLIELILSVDDPQALRAELLASPAL